MKGRGVRGAPGAASADTVPGAGAAASATAAEARPDEARPP